MKVSNYLRACLWFLKFQWQIAPALSLYSAIRVTVQGLLPVASAYLIARLLSDVGQIALQTTTLAETQVYLWLGLLFVASFLGAALISIDEVASERLGNRISLGLNQRLLKHIYKLSQAQFNDQLLADKLERARDSIWRLWQLHHRLSQLLVSLISLLGAIVVVFIYSPLVALALIASLSLIAGYTWRQTNFYEATWHTVTGDSRIASNVTWRLLDLRSMAEIRLLNGFSQLVKIWHKHQLIRNQAMEAARLKYLKPWFALNLLQPAILTATSFYYLQLVIRGSLNLEGFIFLRNVLSEIDSKLEALLSSINSLYSSLLDLNNYSQVYRTKPEVVDGTQQVKSPLTIEFKKVSFAYKDNLPLVLRDISFKIKAGEHLALVGANGAGKTTLVRLLLRQYQPTRGQILVNGRDIKELKLSSYLDQLPSLGQDLLMFDVLSLRENLLVGCRSNISDKQIYQATELVNMSKVIKDLPKGLDSRLGISFNNGVDLSYGQRQRLAIARALIRPSQLLILDEPTSSIDAKSEQAIFSNIHNHFKSRSLLIVAHRFASIKKAAKILVLDKGKIIERGSHKQLIDKAGLYKQMFEAQANAYLDEINTSSN